MDWKSILTDAANIDLEMKRRQAEALKRQEIEEELARKRREAAYEDELRPYKLEEAKAQFEDAKQGRSEKAEAKRKKKESEASDMLWMHPEVYPSEDGMSQTVRIPKKEPADITAEAMARQVVAPFAPMIAQQIINQISRIPDDGFVFDTAAGKAYKTEKGRQKAVMESLREKVGMGAVRDFSKAAPSGTGRSGGGKQPAAGKRRGIPADVSESWDGTTEQVRPTSGATDLMAAISSLGAAPSMGQPAFEGLSGSLQAADPRLERQTVLGKQEEAPYKKALAAWEQSVAGFKRQIINKGISSGDEISEPDAQKLAEQMAGPRPMDAREQQHRDASFDLLNDPSLEPGNVGAPGPATQTQSLEPKALSGPPAPAGPAMPPGPPVPPAPGGVTLPFQPQTAPAVPFGAGAPRPGEEVLAAPPNPRADSMQAGLDQYQAKEQSVARALETAKQAFLGENGTQPPPESLAELEEVLRTQPDLPFGKVIRMWLDGILVPKVTSPWDSYVELNTAVRDAVSVKDGLPQGPNGPPSSGVTPPLNLQGAPRDVLTKQQFPDVAVPQLGFPSPGTSRKRGNSLMNAIRGLK